MDDQKTACAKPCGESYRILSAAGWMLAVIGLLSAITTNRELPILGAGMLPGGLLMVLAAAGGRRGWKGFPWVPFALAALALLWAGKNFALHMKARALQRAGAQSAPLGPLPEAGPAVLPTP